MTKKSSYRQYKISWDFWTQFIENKNEDWILANLHSEDWGLGFEKRVEEIEEGYKDVRYLKKRWCSLRKSRDYEVKCVEGPL